MSRRDALIALTAREINEEGWTCEYHEPEPFGECSQCEKGQRQLATRVVDSLHDTLVGRVIDGWMWCSQWSEVVRPGECDDPAAGDCPGPHERIAQVRP